jgi:hypothetical protein
MELKKDLENFKKLPQVPLAKKIQTLSNFLKLIIFIEI